MLATYLIIICFQVTLSIHFGEFSENNNCHAYCMSQIGGVPRSGTTLARAMLDAHPDIRCGEETRVIPRILGMHTKTVSSQLEMSRLSEAHISEDLLRNALASYILTIIGKLFT